MNMSTSKHHATATSSARIRRLTLMGLLTAISIVLILFVQLPIFPAASYLKYDMADVPILLGAFLLGPAAGLEILLVVCAIQGFFLGGDGVIGFMMHFFSSGALVLVASLLYKKRQDTKGMILGLVLGSLAMTALMVPLNLIFTVHFYGVPQEVVVAGLIPITIPFNLIKAGLNSVIMFLVYKSTRFLFKKQDFMLH